jgi:hypothetical protein
LNDIHTLKIGVRVVGTAIAFIWNTILVAVIEQRTTIAGCPRLVWADILRIGNSISIAVVSLKVRTAVVIRRARLLRAPIHGVNQAIGIPIGQQRILWAAIPLG